jgi:hypothetical protein
VVELSRTRVGFTIADLGAEIMREIEEADRQKYKGNRASDGDYHNEGDKRECPRGPNGGDYGTPSPISPALKAGVAPSLLFRSSRE